MLNTALLSGRLIDLVPPILVVSLQRFTQSLKYFFNKDQRKVSSKRPSQFGSLTELCLYNELEHH